MFKLIKQNKAKEKEASAIRIKKNYKIWKTLMKQKPILHLNEINFQTVLFKN